MRRMQRWKLTCAGNYQTKPHPDTSWSMADLSINLGANKSINMLTLTMIQTLDLFRGLNLGMGAWEGLTVERIAERRKMGWITIWILLAGSEINGSAGGKNTLESSENAREIKNEGEEHAPHPTPHPRIVMDTLFCISPISHYIHWAVTYSHVNAPTGSFAVICSNL